MSLVNDMLRDLEARKAAPESRAGLDHIAAVPNARSPLAQHWIAVAGASTLAIALGGGLYWQHTQVTPSPAQQPVAPAPSQAQAAKPLPTPAPAPAAAQPAPPTVATTSPAPVVAAPPPAQKPAPAPAPAGTALLAALQQKSPGRFALQLVLDSAVAYERTDAPDGVLYRLPTTHFAAGTSEGHFEEGPIVVTWTLEPESDGIRLALEGTSGLKTHERLEPSGKQWQLWVEMELPQEPSTPALAEPEAQSLIQAQAPRAGNHIQETARAEPHGPPSLSIKPRGGQALAAAREAFSRGDYSLAAARLSEQAKLQPDDIEIARWLARSQLAAGERGQLRAWLEPRISQFGRQPELRTLLARAMMEDGDVPRAVEILATGAPSVAQEPDYHALLAAGYQQLGDWQRSAAEYRALVGQNTRSGPWRLGLAIALDQMGQAEDAARNYTAALASTDLESSSRRYAEQRLKALRAGEQ